MSETTAGLRRKIDMAAELQAVVRTMKALAASNIGHYEQSVRALDEYYRTVELGLSVCLRNSALPAGLPARRPERRASPARKDRADSATVGAVVFGSDQGLVGRFNDVIADFAVAGLAALPGRLRVWAVGERVSVRLSDAGLVLAGSFEVPGSVAAIAPLVGEILLASDALTGAEEAGELYLFYNRPAAGAAYEAVSQRLLPLDDRWQRDLAGRPWPTNKLPEIVGDSGGANATLRALIREYIFVSLIRACAASLASENASRLAAMQRADRNIDELRESLNGGFHRLRQSGIDEELFDVVSGFEALN